MSRPAPVPTAALLLALFLALLLPGAGPVRAQTPATDEASAAGGVPRAVWRERLYWPDACEQAYQDAAAATSPVADEGVEVLSSLGGGQLLLRIGCDRFAYQVSQVLALWDGRSGSGRLLDFGETAASAYNTAEPEEGSAARPEVVGLTGFDPASGELTVLTRFRGAGDCGALATYALIDGAVALQRLRLQDVCDGGSADPERWPEVDPATAPPGAG